MNLLSSCIECFLARPSIQRIFCPVVSSVSWLGHQFNCSGRDRCRSRRVHPPSHARRGQPSSLRWPRDEESNWITHCDAFATHAKPSSIPTRSVSNPNPKRNHPNPKRKRGILCILGSLRKRRFRCPPPTPMPSLEPQHTRSIPPRNWNARSANSRLRVAWGPQECLSAWCPSLTLRVVSDVSTASSLGPPIQLLRSRSFSKPTCTPGFDIYPNLHRVRVGSADHDVSMIRSAIKSEMHPFSELASL